MYGHYGEVDPNWANKEELESFLIKEIKELQDVSDSINVKFSRMETNNEEHSKWEINYFEYSSGNKYGFNYSYNVKRSFDEIMDISRKMNNYHSDSNCSMDCTINHIQTRRGDDYNLIVELIKLKN